MPTRRMSRLPLLAASIGVSWLGGGPAHGAEPADTEAGAAWGYASGTGPEQWGKLDPGYGLCATGTAQSPVDIAGSATKTAPAISWQYAALPLALHHDGRTLRGAGAGQDQLRIGTQAFSLVAYEFHGPSEHTIAQRPYDLELQLVHQDGSGATAIVAVLFQSGRHNEALQRIWQHLPASTGKMNPNAKLTFNPTDLLPSDRSFFTYMGSLTNPPCTEGVRWIVLRRPLEASVEQIRRFTSVFQQNARPAQPLNDRKFETGKP